MTQLTCRNLSLGYGRNVIVDNLNFSVNAGDYFCIIGENGLGKSTLMKTLLGLQSPLNGSIIKSDKISQNTIGYLPQRAMIQNNFPVSIKEIVLSGFQGQCGLRPFYNFREKRLADEVMQKLGIFNIAGRCYRELSGGQQQRVLLARALCAARKMLFLDEPISGLDPQTGSEMYNIIAGLNPKNGLTVIMISHDVKEALYFASHVLFLGKSSFFCTKQEYLNNGRNI